MKCPHCDQTLHMSHRDGIEIDYCPECRGVWLDRGELDKIIERSEAWSGSSGGGGGGGGREPEPRRDDPPAAPQKKKKKSSFVGDLFENFGDFGG